MSLRQTWCWSFLLLFNLLTKGDFGDFGVLFAATVARSYERQGGPRVANTLVTLVTLVLIYSYGGAIL